MSVHEFLTLHVLFLYRLVVVFCNLNGAPRRQIDRDDGRRIYSFTGRAVLSVCNRELLILVTNGRAMKSNDSVRWERRERDAFPHAIHLYSTYFLPYLCDRYVTEYSIVSSKKALCAGAYCQEKEKLRYR